MMKPEINAAYWRRFASALRVFQEITDEHALVSAMVNEGLEGIFRSQLRKSLRLLDVGPGLGRIAIAMSFPFHSRVAVEPNPILVQDIEQYYDRILPSKWEDVTCLDSCYSVVIASQVLYYFPEDKRARCISSMIDCLEPGGLLFLTVDTFEGAFGGFIKKWSENLGIPSHVVYPGFVRSILGSRADVTYSEKPLVATLKTRSVQAFLEGVSVYFDVHPHTFQDPLPGYRNDLKTFHCNDEFRAENKEIFWTIRKRA